jgi:hypothetical protein
LHFRFLSCGSRATIAIDVPWSGVTGSAFVMGVTQMLFPPPRAWGEAVAERASFLPGPHGNGQKTNSLLLVLQ